MISLWDVAQDVQQVAVVVVVASCEVCWRGWGFAGLWISDIIYRGVMDFFGYVDGFGWIFGKLTEYIYIRTSNVGHNGR